MNRVQQMSHTRKTDVLAQGIADTQAAVLERFEDVEARMQQFRERLDEVRAQVEASRCKLEVAFDVLHQCYQDDREREALTFWQRLRWLVRGV